MKNTDNLRKKVDDAKTKFEKQTFKIGRFSIKLTSTVMYLFCLLCAILIWTNISESSAEITSRRFDNINVVIEGETALARKELAVFELIDKTVSITFERLNFSGTLLI